MLFYAYHSALSSGAKIPESSEICPYVFAVGDELDHHYLIKYGIACDKEPMPYKIGKCGILMTQIKIRDRIPGLYLLYYEGSCFGIAFAAVKACETYIVTAMVIKVSPKAFGVYTKLIYTGVTGLKIRLHLHCKFFILSLGKPIKLKGIEVLGSFIHIKVYAGIAGCYGSASANSHPAAVKELLIAAVEFFYIKIRKLAKLLGIIRKVFCVSYYFICISIHTF